MCVRRPSQRREAFLIGTVRAPCRPSHGETKIARMAGAGRGTPDHGLGQGPKVCSARDGQASSGMMANSLRLDRGQLVGDPTKMQVSGGSVVVRWMRERG